MQREWEGVQIRSKGRKRGRRSRLPSWDDLPLDSTTCLRNEYLRIQGNQERTRLVNIAAWSKGKPWREDSFGIILTNILDCDLKVIDNLCDERRSEGLWFLCFLCCYVSEMGKKREDLSVKRSRGERGEFEITARSSCRWESPYFSTEIGISSGPRPNHLSQRKLRQARPSPLKSPPTSCYSTCLY